MVPKVRLLPGEPRRGDLQRSTMLLFIIGPYYNAEQLCNVQHPDL